MQISFFSNQKYNKIFTYVILAYALVMVVLVWRSSFVAIDGHRHFSLFDDAMISMRYADNLAHGKGLVWNEGQRVEGFTNPLMVFIMAGAIKIFGQSLSVLVIQLLGIALALANIWLVAKIARPVLEASRVYSDELLAVILVLLIGWYPVTYWSVFGMETGLLTTMVLYVIYLGFIKPSVSKVNWWFALLLGLTYLIRPDSLLFIAIVYVFRALARIRTVRECMLMVGEGIITLVPIVGYHWFRHEYYHQLWPNTYILKATGMMLVDRVKNGLAYFGPFLMRVTLMLAAVVLFIFFYAFDEQSALKEKIKRVLFGSLAIPIMCVVLFGVFAAYQVYVGGDPWPPFWRMTVPYTVLLFIGFVVFAALLAQLLAVRTDRFRALLWLVIAAFWVLIPFDYHYDVTRIQPYQSLNNFENINQALAIRDITDGQATVASFWAGTIPYYDGRISLDPLGKMDPYIARLAPDLDGPFHNRGMTSIPGHNKYDLSYTFQQLQPDVIQYMPVDGHVCAWGHQNVESWCMEHYQKITYQGMVMLVKRNSSHIKWNKLTEK